MLTIKQIRAAKPTGKMTKVSGSNQIKFDNGVTFTAENSREQTKLWNKLKKAGYEQHYNFSSDEFAGLAAAKPEEVFNYSILTA